MFLVFRYFCLLFYVICIMPVLVGTEYYAMFMKAALVFIDEAHLHSDVQNILMAMMTTGRWFIISTATPTPEIAHHVERFDLEGFVCQREHPARRLVISKEKLKQTATELSIQPFLKPGKLVLVCAPNLGQIKRWMESRAPVFQGLCDRSYGVQVDGKKVAPVKFVSVTGRMKHEDQQEAIWDPFPEGVKFLLATSILDSAVTLPAISAVIDLGAESAEWCDPKTMFWSVSLFPARQTVKDQRRGRLCRIQDAKGDPELGLYMEDIMLRGSCEPCCWRPSMGSPLSALEFGNQRRVPMNALPVAYSEHQLSTAARRIPRGVPGVPLSGEAGYLLRDSEPLVEGAFRRMAAYCMADGVFEPPPPMEPKWFGMEDGEEPEDHQVWEALAKSHEESYPEKRSSLEAKYCFRLIQRGDFVRLARLPRYGVEEAQMSRAWGRFTQYLYGLKAVNIYIYIYI